MAIRLNGSTSGYVELDAPATAGSNTLVLPDGNGTSGQYLQTDGSGGLSWQTVNTADSIEYVWNTQSGSLSGSALTLTNIPSSAYIIIFNVYQCSANTSADWNLKVRANGSTITSGYQGAGTYNGASNNGRVHNSSFRTYGMADGTFIANLPWFLHRVSGNVWFCRMHGTVDNWAQQGSSVGRVDTSAHALDGLEFSPDTGSFDSGTYSLSYLTQV